MRIGFYTDYSESIAAFAQEVGFTSLELSAWPTSTFNADTITDDRIGEIRADLDARGIVISSLGYYPNPLDTDAQKAEEAIRYLRKVIDLAPRVGVDTVCTFVGQIQDKAVGESMQKFKEVFTPLCDYAGERSVRLAIENCPMRDHRTGHGENIAFSPEMWDAMFELVDSPALGLEIDPSHLVFQGIDHIACVQDYGAKIFHVHAKDVEIMRRKLDRFGIYGQQLGRLNSFGHGWWRFRTPGFGEIDWAAFVTALIDIGYDGSLDIEHEDEVFAAQTIAAIGSEADIVEMMGREQNGLILGYRHLSQFIPPLGADALLPV